MSSRARSALAFAALFALTASPCLLAQFDPAKSPVDLPPLARYTGSEMEPVAVLGDNSDFDVDNSLAFGQSFFHDLDIAGGYLFAAAGRNFEIYDISPIPSTANNFEAQRVGRNTLPFWGNADGGGSFFLNFIRAANDDLVAIGMEDQGFSVWNTSNKRSPSVHYQDKGVLAKKMHLVFKNGSHWAFVAHAGSQGGLFLYNVSAASNLNFCLDDSPSSTPCSGVFQGEIGNRFGVTALDGFGDYVAVVEPGLSGSVDILDVDSPLSPTTKLTGNLAPASSEAVTDVALWQDAGKLYLAAVIVVGPTSTSTVRIYDVTCATTPGSCGLPGAMVSIPASDPTGGTQSTITHSSTGSREFLHVGNSRRSGCAAQREYLFDVTAPTNAFDISPAVDPAGYWGWFYMDCATGFNNVKPWRGYFFGDTFYRAAHSSLDVHRLAGASPPVSSFTCSPTTPFVGQPVNCTDTSTGAPDQWSWTFQDATPPTSTLRNPSVVFNSVGVKQVTLVASNPAGPSANTATSTINVVDPSPSVDSVTPDVTSALVCSQVTFVADNATGQTPLTFDWTVDDATPTTVDTGTGNPFVWDIPPGQAPGDYTATVTVDNAIGPPAMATSPPVTVVALPPLAFNGPPTHDAFSGSTVQFHIDADGATEWNWHFGDGTSTGFISDPVDGPNPQHTYTVSGNYDVTVEIRNCVEGPITSAPLNINVTVEPLDITIFRATCPLGFCVFDTGDTVSFNVNVDGTPIAYDYDWDGDGTYEETSATEIDMHIFCTDGRFEPVLRVRRGLDRDTQPDTNANDLVINAGATCSAPTAPTGLTVTPSGQSLALSWSDLATGETGYRVLRSIDGVEFDPIAALPPNANGFVDANVDPDVTYTYQVQVYALTGAGTSNSASGQVSVNIFADGFDDGTTLAWKVFIE